MFLSTVFLCAKEQQGSLEGMGSLGLTATTVQAMPSLVGHSPMGSEHGEQSQVVAPGSINYPRERD